MRMGVTYENEEIFQHFGHTGQFKLYDVEVLICGGIGAGAQSALADAGCTHHEHEHSSREHHCGEDKHGCTGR